LLFKSRGNVDAQPSISSSFLAERRGAALLVEQPADGSGTPPDARGRGSLHRGGIT
jgi:hypothetical protein